MFSPLYPSQVAVFVHKIKSRTLANGRRPSFYGLLKDTIENVRFEMKIGFIVKREPSDHVLKCNAQVMHID